MVPKRQQEVTDKQVEGREADALARPVTLKGQRDLVFVRHPATSPCGRERSASGRRRSDNARNRGGARETSGDPGPRPCPATVPTVTVCGRFISRSTARLILSRARCARDGWSVKLARVSEIPKATVARSGKFAHGAGNLKIGACVHAAHCRTSPRCGCGTEAIPGPHFAYPELRCAILATV